MYLHLGQETVIPMSDIIGVFDLDNTTISKKTRNFLAKAERDGNIVNVSTELPKSFIVTQRGNEKKVYISQISAATLLKRTGFINEISNI